MARCKVYEIQGPDSAATAGAVRCHRDADGTRDVDKKSFPICAHHNKKPWQLFVKDGWVYAVDLNAPELKREKRARKRRTPSR